MHGVSLKRLWPANQRPRRCNSPALSDDSTPACRSAPRVLLLSVSAGHGHLRAAEALCACAVDDFPALRMHHVDIMTIVPKLFRKLYVDAYLGLVSHLPRIWGWLYRKTDKLKPNRFLEPVRQLFQTCCAPGLQHELARFAPDAIICTHFLPAELVAAHIRRGQLSCPLWVQITDFDLHRMWVHEGITGYFVATKQLADRLRALGIAASRIHVTGIPVMPAFMMQSRRPISADQSHPHTMVIILMGGGTGLGGLDAVAQQLLSLDPAIALIVLAGKNLQLLKTMQAMSKANPNRLTAAGFTDQVPQLMRLADMAITKPGGLSSSECLVMGLPMILINPIPGQEERNSDYLVQQGVALRADNPSDLACCVQRLFSDRDSLANMRSRALAIARPAASRALLSKISMQL